jgi:hypothetical protein
MVGVCLRLPIVLTTDKYAGRKIHYTMDIVMALCWALACGFSSFLPYWYVVWIITVVVQRAIRDVKHCRAKYGDVCFLKEYWLILGMERVRKIMSIHVHTCILPWMLC